MQNDTGQQRQSAGQSHDQLQRLPDERVHAALKGAESDDNPPSNCSQFGMDSEQKVHM